MKENGIPMYDKRDMADINIKYGNFHINGYPYIPRYFIWKNGALYAIGDADAVLGEFLYVHFQKRPLKMQHGLDTGKIDEIYFAAPFYVGNKEITGSGHILEIIQFRIMYYVRRVRRGLQYLYRDLKNILFRG